jgi:hypothetical protein
MTLPIHPNSISASQIRTEFGATSGNPNTGPVRLGAYRISQTVAGLSNLPLDTGVPQGTSTIGFGNLRGTKLNVVVDCTAPSGQWKTKVNAKQDYNDNNNITVIGGFKTRPPSSAGTKVIIHTNGNIGSYVYLSRSSRGVYCTYDVIVGNEECYPQTDGDGNYITDGDGNIVYYCPPIYEQRTNLYGYLHFYASPSEIKSTDYTIESKYYIRVFPRQEPNTTPLYRLYNPNNLDHLYTIDINEWNNSGYNQQGIVGYVYASPGANRQPVYRLYKIYNPPSGNCATIIDRLFTTDANEYNNGYNQEGIGFYAPTFVSDASSANSCSLLTGSWDAATDLIVDIGPSARIYGDGGNGGDGGTQGANGANGLAGTSGIGVIATNSTTIRIASGAIVAGGGGGGGGGGGAVGARVNRGKGFLTYAGGGGGGGGAGYPGGAGGNGGVASKPGVENQSYNSGTAGAGGTLDSGGTNGGGGAATLGPGCQAFGGAGGGGGGRSSNGGTGVLGSQASSNGQNGYVGSGGAGGPNGHGIVINVPSTSVTISNNGSVNEIVYNTIPV